MGRVHSNRALGLYWLAVLSTLGLFIVLLMGFTVTDTGSAQGCGAHWPLCHGQILPSLNNLHTFVEFSHRAITGVVSLLIFALAVWAWRAFSASRVVKVLAGLAVLFLLAQAFIGAAAVLWQQSNTILALHFGISLISFASVFLLTVVIRQFTRSGGGARWSRDVFTPADSELKRFAWWSMVYLYAVIYWGAYVAHVGAGLACSGWPLCNGGLLPPHQFLAEVAWLHRLAALILLIVTWRYVALVGRVRSAYPGWYRAVLLEFFLVWAQAFSGALLVLDGLSFLAILLHVTLVIALFTAHSYGCLETVRWQSIPGRMGPSARRS